MTANNVTKLQSRSLTKLQDHYRSPDADIRTFDIKGNHDLSVVIETGNERAHFVISRNGKMKLLAAHRDQEDITFRTAKALNVEKVKA